MATPRRIPRKLGFLGEGGGRCLRRIHRVGIGRRGIRRGYSDVYVVGGGMRATALPSPTIGSVACNKRATDHAES